MSKRVQTVGMLLALTSMAIGGGNAAYAGTATSVNEAQDVKQDAQCKGVVVDAAGEPVVGATVLVKGKTGVGTVTDIDGNFSLKNVTKGDVIRMVTGTGGGYGNPLARDEARVAMDVKNEYITVDDAREIYGVEVDPVSFAVVGYTQARKDFQANKA